MRIEVAVLLEAIDIANPARHANSRLGELEQRHLDALLASSPGTRSQQRGRVSD
ncbi:hypothetical protein ABTX61_34135 [Amycolatopsis japonica]|uniref:hypothetical protein n=1 Tax=Amycolatopsis japonica TaxID=208439 RepID=UPI00331E74EB